MTEIKITRRIALDKPYEYYELEATYDPAQHEQLGGNKLIKAMEKQVAFIMKATAPKESKPSKKAAKIPTKKPEPTEDIKITDLQDGDKKINIKVRFLKIGPVKTFTKTDGTEGKLSKINVENDSGKILLTAWDDQAVQAQEIKENAWVFLQSAYVTEYKENLELNVGNWSKMEVVYNG